MLHVLHILALFLKQLCGRSVRDQSEQAEMEVYEHLKAIWCEETPLHAAEQDTGLPLFLLTVEPRDTKASGRLPVWNAKTHKTKVRGRYSILLICKRQPNRFLSIRYPHWANQKGLRAEVSEDLKRRRFLKRAYINMDEHLQTVRSNQYIKFGDWYSVGRMSLVGLEEDSNLTATHLHKHK
jgi:hypothetical protein